MPDCAICGTNGAALTTSAQGDDEVCADNLGCFDRLVGGFYLEYPRVIIPAEGDATVWILDAIGGEPDGPDMADLHREQGRRLRKTVPVRALFPAFS